MSNSPSPSRVLAPAPSQLQKRKGSSDDAVPGRKHKTTACRACKKKKLRCRGEPPCEHCVASRIECVVDEMADMRRKFAMKRKLERLEQAEDILSRLIGTLREGENKRITQLLNLIRSEASFDELQMFLNQEFSLSEIERSPQLREIRAQISRSSPESEEEIDPRKGPRRKIDVHRLADIPFIRVPAKPWTSVTDDDEVVSHLVSLYISWVWSSMSWFNRDLFIRDMQSGDLDSQYCSPFLVNSILSEACFFSDYAEAFAVPGDLNSRGEHFLDEARRLLAEEQAVGHTKLTTIQGLMVFSMRLVMMGKDRLGWVYLNIATRAADEYCAVHPESPANTPSQRAHEETVNRMVWAIFCAMSNGSLIMMKYMDIKPPQRPRIPSAHDNQKDVWIPYPQGAVPVMGHHGCSFNRWCDLSLIAVHINQVFLGLGSSPKSSELVPAVNDIYNQLQGWYANLPECLKYETTQLPYVVILHVGYHTVTLQAFSLMRNHLKESDHPDLVRRATESCFASARQIAHLLCIHRQRWGLDRLAYGEVASIMPSLFVFLEDLEPTENRNAFIELCVLMRMFSRRYLAAKGMLRMIQLSAMQQGVTLPQETHALFVDFETQSWRGGDAEGISSQYPHFPTALKPNASQDEAVTMDDFLKKWDGLSLSERESSGEPAIKRESRSSSREPAF